MLDTGMGCILSYSLFLCTTMNSALTTRYLPFKTASAWNKALSNFRKIFEMSSITILLSNFHPLGVGVNHRPTNMKERMELTWISLGGGGVKENLLCGGRYQYFLELHNITVAKN